MTTLITAPTGSPGAGWSNGAGTVSYNAGAQTFTVNSKTGANYFQAVDQKFAAVVGDNIVWDLDMVSLTLGSSVTKLHVAIRRDSDWTTVAEQKLTANITATQRITVTHTATVNANYYVLFYVEPNATGTACQYVFKTDTFNVYIAGPPVITTTTLPALAVGTPVSTTLAATGTTPITWAVTAGTPPAGLALSSAGALTGTPTTTGAYDFTVTATNDAGTDTQQYTGTVAAPPFAGGLGAVAARLREPIIIRVGVEYPGTPNGTEMFSARAAIWPLSSTEAAERGRDPSSVSYRAIIAWPDVLPASTDVEWRGQRYRMVGPSMQHTKNGVLHHQEIIITRATG